jgi:hypothetical protein
MMEMLKFVVPGATGLLGLVKLLDKRYPALRILTTVFIIIGGAGSALMIQQSGRAEERRAVAAEQAQKRAEDKLDRMSDALLGIQQDLAELQMQLARAPQGSTGAAAAGASLKSTIQKVNDAKQIVRPTEPPVGTQETPAAPTPPATQPATKAKAGE